MRPQTLNNYLAGQMNPGNKVQAKLRALGCNIEELMTGSSHVEQKECSEEETRILHLLRTLGIDSEEKLKAFLNPQGIAQDVALVMRDRMLKYRSKKRRKR